MSQVGKVAMANLAFLGIVLLAQRTVGVFSDDPIGAPWIDVLMALTLSLTFPTCLLLVFPHTGGPNYGDIPVVVALVLLNAYLWGYALTAFMGFGKCRKTVDQENDSEQDPPGQ